MIVYFRFKFIKIMKKLNLIYLLIGAILFGCQLNPSLSKSKLDIDRLSLIDEMIEKAIKKNKIPGAVALIAKDNEVVYKKAFGVKDPETGEKLKTDDIFRIASMTKAITSLGIIMLWEKAMIYSLDDPIDLYIPEFRTLKVLDNFNKKDSTYTSKPTNKKITIRNLLTHTSGMGYDEIGSSEIRAVIFKEKRKFMRNSVIAFSDEDITIGETIRGLAKLPLEFEPGVKWNYSNSIDVLGYLIEVVSGKTLDEFFKDEIFNPLGMDDTYFYLPEGKNSRLVKVQTKKEEKWVTFRHDRYNVNYPIEGAKKFYSGGAGLSSTAEDYFKFLSVFLNDGKYNDIQIIGKMTNKLLQLDQIAMITSDKHKGSHGLISTVVREEDLNKGNIGSAGTLHGGGYFNTKYFADPNEKVIGILLKQTRSISEHTSNKFNRLVFSSITQ